MRLALCKREEAFHELMVVIRVRPRDCRKKLFHLSRIAITRDDTDDGRVFQKESQSWRDHVGRAFSKTLFQLSEFRLELRQ